MGTMVWVWDTLSARTGVSGNCDMGLEYSWSYGKVWRYSVLREL